MNSIILIFGIKTMMSKKQKIKTSMMMMSLRYKRFKESKL